LDRVQQDNLRLITQPRSARHTLTMFAHVLAVRLHCVCVLPSSS
jgi:hypothetical protein